MNKQKGSEAESRLPQEAAQPGNSGAMVVATVLRQVAGISEAGAFAAAQSLLDENKLEKNVRPSLRVMELALESLRHRGIKTAEAAHATGSDFIDNTIQKSKQVAVAINLLNHPGVEHPFPEDSDE